MNISPCSNSQPSPNHCPQVSDDIPKHIVGNDHVKTLGILHHPHTNSIHMSIIRFNVFKLFPHLIKGSLPEVKGIGQNVCFSAEGEFVFLIPLATIFKGKTDATLHPFP